MALFRKAAKKRVYSKTLISGTSGSGKTYSALRLANGMAKALGATENQIMLLDTESGRGEINADRFGYFYFCLRDNEKPVDPGEDASEKLREDYEAAMEDWKLANDILPKPSQPYCPENYIAIIREAVKEGIKILIIDSLSHEWKYILEQSNIPVPGNPNKMAPWAKLTPRHDALFEEILQAPLHIICTARAKDEYVIEDSDGKKVPKKVGLGSVQRNGIEYEYTTTIILDQDTHVAKAEKDNTHTLEDQLKVLDERDGERIIEWCNSGKGSSVQDLAYAERIARATAEEAAAAEIEKVKNDAVAIAREIAANGMDAKELGKLIKEIAGVANINAIEDIEKAKAVLSKLEELTAEAQ